MKHKDILNSLTWRYATKKFDSSKKVSDADLEFLLETQRMAPTSFGLQPWKTVVVTDPVIRQRLREEGGSQPQFTDSTALLVICARTDIDDGYVKKYIDLVAQTREMDRADLARFEQSLLGFVNNTPEEAMLVWAKNQAHITLGFILSAAAQIGVDTCPMGGFDAKVFDETLNLKEQNLTSAVLCAVGYRAEDDKMAEAKKVRFSPQEMFIRV